MKYPYYNTLVPLILLAACGGDGGRATPDASSTDAAIDASVIDAPVVDRCDYSEKNDATNDDVSGTVDQGVAEDTEKMFGVAKQTICGQLDSTHFVAPELIDIDGYRFKVSEETDLRIDVSGAGLESLRDVTVELYTGPQLGDLVGETVKFFGDHAVYEAHAVPGEYELVIQGGNAAAIGAPVPYKAKISIDKPAMRCPPATGSAAYNESLDRAANYRANDMVSIQNPIEKLTAAANDMPEPTALTIAPNMHYRITGSSADIAAISSYKDIDTFQITTGATTNEIAVRLNWPGTMQDLDLFVFAAGSIPRIGRSITAAKHEDEFKTLSVKPNSTYWLTVGNDKNSDAGAVSYGLTVCGAAFTP